MIIKYYLITYGCQMNKSDSERIATILDLLNYQPTTDYQLANLIIINMCSVRQSAVDRVYGKINQIKKNNPKTKIILTGCILKKDQKKLNKQVDFFFNIKQLTQLPKRLSYLWLKKKQKIDVPFSPIQYERTNLSRSVADKDNHKTISLSNPYLEIEPCYQNKFSAYLPIMTGCNNFCSYCVVPYTRGREISRPTDKILAEVKRLVNDGYKEIVLLGQNVNSYHGQLKEKSINFAQLLQLINNLTGDFWIRFITSHPKDLSDQLIRTIAREKRITKYLHLAIQSGSNKILKKMNRGYTVNYYLNLIKKIRQSIPNITLSTDIIVGFPGETKSDFQQTGKLLRQIKFDMAYIARYSPRAETASSKMKDDVSIIEKKRREKELTDILQTTALFNNRKYLQKNVTVLIGEKIHNNPLNQLINNESDNRMVNRWFGRTNTFKKVMVELAPDHRHSLQVGQWQLVKITQVNPWGLTGIAIS